MRRNSRMSGLQVLVAGLLMSVFLIAASQAQSDLSLFTGKFTLTHQILWGETVLRPGDYTISIESGQMPTFALIRDGQGRPVARFMSGIDAGRAGVGNALLLSEKGGQLRVYSLALGSLGRVWVYDPALAREVLLEARAQQTVPLMLAKR
jgi:hypothetical protein